MSIHKADQRSPLIREPLKEEILKGLIVEKEFFCLDVLNGYVHSKDTEYLNKQYLNGFWDHIFPLLQAMLDKQEVDD